MYPVSVKISSRAWIHFPAAALSMLKDFKADALRRCFCLFSSPLTFLSSIIHGAFVRSVRVNVLLMLHLEKKDPGSQWNQPTPHAEVQKISSAPSQRAS